MLIQRSVLISNYVQFILLNRPDAQLSPKNYAVLLGVMRALKAAESI